MTVFKSYSDVPDEDIAELLASGRFDPQAYLERYPDVAQSGLDPARHYLWLGQKLGRKADPSSSPTPPTQKRSVSRPKVSHETDLDALFIDGTNGTSSTPYRVGRIANGLAQSGWSVRIEKGDDVEKLMKENIRPRFAVFYRAPYWSPYVEFVEQLRKTGAYIVYDVDDFVFDKTIIPQIDGYKVLTEDQKRGFVDGVDAYRNFILNADLCTLATNFLVDEVKKLGTPAARVRNSISDENIQVFEDINYQRPERPSPFVVGYYSGTKTHQADFAVAAPAIIQFMQENPDVIFRVIGELDVQGWPELENWQHDHRPGHVTRVVRVGLMPHDVMLRDQFSCDVILAPLEIGNAFCEAKSELKFFEGSLAKAPVIASATRTFVEASDNGRLAHLAVTTEDWKRSLDSIYDNYSDALGRAEDAYIYVRQHYSQDFAANEALEAYEAFAGQVSGAAPVKAKKSANSAAQVAVILPDFTGPSGGHRKIFMVCQALVNAGLSVHLYFYTDREPAVIQRDIPRFFANFEAKVSRFDKEIGPHDAVICTQWRTAYDFKDIDFDGSVFYFVQDLEPLFYACGSEYVRALASYRLGFHMICYGRWVAAQIEDNIGAKADVIPFTLDHKAYSRPKKEIKRDIDVLVYARPDQDRRCLDLIVEGLIKLKSERPETKIAFFGEVDYPNYGFEFESLGVFSDLSKLAALYRRTKVGICYSPTNPSQLGYEMVACGACLIDVDIKYAELNFGGDEFVLYSNGLPEDMSAACQKLLDDEGERERRQTAGYAFAKAMPHDDDLGRSFLEVSGLGELARNR